MRRVSFVLALLTLVLCAVARASDIPLVASSVVPAATGKVSYEHDRNGNLKFKVEVKHLADPARLTPARTCYVVWIRSTDGQLQNAGVLKINHDLEGSFSTTTPVKGFDVVITAEDSPSASQPSGPEAMHASIQVR